MEIVISRKSWHFWLYSLSANLWEEWMGNWRYSDNSENINVCTYVRLIFVYLPITLAVLVVTWFSLPLFVYFLYTKYGLAVFAYAFAPLGDFMLLIYLSAFKFSLPAFLVFYILYEAIKNNFWLKSDQNIQKPSLLDAERFTSNDVSEKVEAIQAVKITSFWDICVDYFSNKHAMICRKITITQTEGEKL